MNEQRLYSLIIHDISEYNNRKRLFASDDAASQQEKKISSIFMN